MSAALHPQRLVLDRGVGPVTIAVGGVFGPTLRRLAGLPAVSMCQVDFRAEPAKSGMRWMRRYSVAEQATSCDTTVRSTVDGFVEQRGPVAMTFVLAGDGLATLHSVRFLGVPLPRRMLSGRIESAATDDGLCTDVQIALGNGAAGWLRYVADLRTVSP